jgi:hypothetical protein
MGALPHNRQRCTLPCHIVDTPSDVRILPGFSLDASRFRFVPKQDQHKLTFLSETDFFVRNCAVTITRFATLTLITDPNQRLPQAPEVAAQRREAQSSVT